MEPCRFDAVEALARIRSGRLTASALTRSCLDRIAEREPVIRAFAHLDASEAMRQAAACDAAKHDGGLFGLPVGVKDICDTADMPTAYGSRRYTGHRPKQDAACVATLRHAGAVIPGKTATTEFAGPEPAATRNPRNTSFSPGGSSAGSAAAVADHMLPVAIGTQTAGSVIRPAAFCGIIGIKPTFGLILITGIRPAASSFDTLGTFGRTVADAALPLAVLAGDPALAACAAQAFLPRIGLCRTPAWAEADADVRAALESAASLLARAGAVVRELTLPTLFDQGIDHQIAVMSAESHRILQADFAAGTDDLGPQTVVAGRAGATVTDEQETRSRAGLAHCRAAFDVALDDVDILICPSAAAEAPEGLGWTGDPVFNRLWTGLGVPCLTLPFTVGDRGLPIGIQVVGRSGQDARMLAAASWLEQAIGARVPEAERS